ncbi:MAG TPA: FAD-dependent oxidoreductase, partial [Chthoniobacteraceae bacterium]|nr:FAD-dependent oxidoreductase [Chthoniobacteraceae bacterium]
MHPLAKCLLVFLLAVVAHAMAAPVIETDLCVYGGTSGGVAAAVQAARLGKTVALAVFGNHVGGLTSGGLGQTDVGNNGNAYIQGISREFYNRVAQFYSVGAPKFTFEPHVAEQIYLTMLSEAGVTPRYGQQLASVTMDGLRIKEIAMEDGTIYRAKMFLDTTYEGDLMAMAGVTFTVGRESAATYGESLNGIRASTPSHQFTVNVDPYVTPGNPASGLLPYIQPGNGGTPGAGDNKVQAYNYRMCLTTNAANRLPIAAPPGYGEANYELLGRLIDARLAAGDSLTLASFMNIASMPNAKTDINNNGAFSTDFIGLNYDYPTASYSQREAIETAHKNYIQGFLYYLGHSSRVPSNVRSQMLSYGFCADEFQDSGGFGQIYVREGRRMVSDYVMLQQNCQGTRVAPDSIGLGSYTMDSHNCQRIVQGGVVKNEGDVQSGTPAPYPISYRSIVPRVGECENLLITFALSASHIGFGSARMEPVFMITSQSAATAAAFAIDDGVAVQAVSYPKLALQLQADGQALSNSGSSNSGIIVDDTDAGATITGTWLSSTSVTGYYGSDYLHDDNASKGSKSVRFTPNLPDGGDYDVYLRWTTNANRATNVPVTVTSAAGTSSFTVNQQNNNGVWVKITTANFAAGTAGSLLISNTGTNGYVIADAARWTAVGAAAQVQVVASDAQTREGAADSARFSVVRVSDEAGSAITVHYTLSGSGVSRVDPTTGTATLAAGQTVATVSLQAVADNVAQGTEDVTLTLNSGAGYSVGPLSSATVEVLDRPIDEWRHANFSPAELADPAVSGDTADIDDDGLITVEEYALARDPHRFDGNAFSGAIAGGHLTLSYTRSKAATDVAISAEGSDNLSLWGTNGVVEQTGLIELGDTQQVTVRLIAPIA